tara:strand:- start:13016 stop:14029 length:1014 start_codon:yes stop_codon:yes gene_type:complete
MPRFSLVFLALFTLLRTVGLPEAVLGNESLKSVTRQAYLMGTKVHLSVRTSDRAAGLIQLEQMLKVLEKTEAELSTWRAESLVSRLNRHPINQVWHADLEFCNLFKQLARWHQETNGAFDPVVGDLLRNQENESNISEPSTKALFGFKYLNFDGKDCTVVRLRDVSVDVGAFGKGYALDRVEHTLEEFSKPWMIDVGGQLMVSGLAETESWPFAIANPVHRMRTVLNLNLKEGSISVSGGSERDRLVNGVRLGHILDPRSGRPVNDAGSVIVWHRKALLADILSTALFVMGVEEGIRWADERGIAACFIVPGDSVVEKAEELRFVSTRAFRAQFSLP